MPNIFVLIIVVSDTETFVKYFEKYGEITDSVIMKDRQTGRPRGFGFITYADPTVVDQVIQDNHVINGKQVRFSSLFDFVFWFVYVFFYDVCVVNRSQL